jgi:hypothetical protein
MARAKSSTLVSGEQITQSILVFRTAREWAACVWTMMDYYVVIRCGGRRRGLRGFLASGLGDGNGR